MVNQMMSHGKSSSSPYVNVVNDPWNAPAAHLPDEYSGATVPLKIRQSVTLTPTATAGAAAVGFYPQLSLPFNTASMSGTTTTIASWPAGSALEDYASLSAAFKFYRFVSVGCCCTYVGAESTAAGEIIMVPLTGLVFSTETSLIISDWRDYPGAVSASIPFMRKTLCGAVSNFDKPGFAPLSTNFVNTFPSILVGVIGAPNSACIRVDFTINIEAVPLVTNPMSHMARVIPQDSRALNLVSRRLPAARMSNEGTEGVIDTKIASYMGRVGGARTKAVDYRRARPPTSSKYHAADKYKWTTQSKRKKPSFFKKYTARTFNYTKPRY